MLEGIDIALPLGLGVVSSLHCAQMCGPIVVSYSMGGRATAAGHFAYNAGRIATSAVLGAVARGASSKLLLGLAMGFLPCGLLYAGLLKAASTGTALGGAASMAAFGVGTAGALLGIGLFSSVVG